MKEPGGAKSIKAYFFIMVPLRKRSPQKHIEAWYSSPRYLDGHTQPIFRGPTFLYRQILVMKLGIPQQNEYGMKLEVGFRSCADSFAIRNSLCVGFVAPFPNS